MGLQVGSRGGGGGAVGRRSRLSFQCEEVEGGTSTEHVFKPRPKHSHTHSYSTRLSVFMYSVEWKDLVCMKLDTTLTLPHF